MSGGGLLRVVGGVTGVLLGFVSALVEIFWSAAYLGSVRLPLAAVLAVVGNVALVWFTYRVTGHRGVALLPGLAWMVPIVVASGATAEGDQLLRADNWVALLTLFGGATAWTVAAFRLVIMPRPVGIGPQAGLSELRPAAHLPRPPGSGPAQTRSDQPPPPPPARH